MYDDYDLDYSFTQDYTYDLDEMYEHYIQSYASDVQALDSYEEDYARDTQDYDTLAYKHYAWYNKHTRTRLMYTAQKRLVRVTLDITCYDDLDVEDLNWRELLQLEGDEEVDISIRDYSDYF